MCVGETNQKTYKSSPLWLGAEEVQVHDVCTHIIVKVIL